MTMNTEGIVSLLKMMDLAKQWPEFQGLHDAARAELVQANAAAVRDLKAEADRQAAAKAKADAELAAKHRMEQANALRSDKGQARYTPPEEPAQEIDRRGE